MPKQLLYTATSQTTNLGDTKPLFGYLEATLVIQGLTVETVSVNPLVGAVIGSGIPVFTAAGVVQASTALANGTYYIRDLAVDRLRFTKSAAAETATVTLLAA